LRNLFERDHASSFEVELRALCSRTGVLLGAAVCLTFFSLAVDSGKAEEVTDDWVQLTVVPQLGGSLGEAKIAEAREDS
jgi:hypothetical protein